MYVYKFNNNGIIYFCGEINHGDERFYEDVNDVFSNDYIEIRNVICVNFESLACMRDTLPIIEVKDNTKITKTDAIYVYYKEEEKVQSPLDITYQAIAELSVRQAELEKENQALKEELKHLERK